jgi:hypothetical protein
VPNLETARGWWQLGRDVLLTTSGIGILALEAWRPGPGEAWVAIIAAGLGLAPAFTRKGDREDPSPSTRPGPEGPT